MNKTPGTVKSNFPNVFSLTCHRRPNIALFRCQADWQGEPPADSSLPGNTLPLLPHVLCGCVDVCVPPQHRHTLVYARASTHRDPVIPLNAPSPPFPPNTDVLSNSLGHVKQVIKQVKPSLYAEKIRLWVNNLYKLPGMVIKAQSRPESLLSSNRKKNVCRAFRGKLTLEVYK